MATICVIPARYDSQRLPGKPLLPIHGRPLIQWVVEAARRIQPVSAVVVATDHEDIVRAAEQAGARGVMTSSDLPSGTDRIHAAIKDMEADVIINLQGDEPLMPPETVELAHARLLESGADASTACVAIRIQEEFEDPNVVKVVRAEDETALYFSRSPVPSLSRRDPEELRQSGYVFGHKHLGLYIYRRSALQQFCSLSPSPLEKMEKLEQLRMLENGMRIICVTSPRDSIGVDTPEDMERVEKFLIPARE